MGKKKSYDILVVDDDTSICKILYDLFNSQGYAVRTAGNGIEAIDLIEQKLPDLVMSDIQMPGMGGFELFRILKSRYPSVKHIMMTSYDVDRYISSVREHNIGNIILKGADFSLEEISSYVKTLLSGDIFGLKRFFPGCEIKTVSIQSYANTKEIIPEISQLAASDRAVYLEIAIDELVSNAFFHGVLQMTGVPREQWSEDFIVPVEKAVKVSWAVDESKIGVAIEDPQGNLKKEAALRWLDSCRDETTDEEHGRGLMLVRKLIDRLIINIDPGRRTECIVIQYNESSKNISRKPLLIHEL
ncbi:MAG TPA: response regulator [Chitinispirillaceae bacterium]|nr:response regulator [Chitinispirillaceae bacterium]